MIGLGVVKERGTYSIVVQTQVKGRPVL